MAMKRNVNETLENREAFEYYYALGKPRGLAAVAAKFGKSDITVKRWSKSFNWQERIKLRDIDIGKQVERATDAHVVASRAMYRETIGFLVTKFKEQVIAGAITISKVEDFVKIVNLDMELMGVGSGDGEGNMQSLKEILDKSAMMLRDRLDGKTSGDDTPTVVN